MKLFLDANIYLRFYDSKKENFQKLIDPLLQAKNNIIITNQIVDEVIRNRFSGFKRSFDGYLQQSQILNTELPVHISTASDQKVKDWNAARKKLFQDVQKSNTELAKIVDTAIDEVYEGHDKVSKSFDQIFKRSLKPKPKEIETATLRKALGNPPGKRTDPFGDQLSWTQLMNSLKGAKTLIMVTADRDYSVEASKKKLRLDPLLMRELKAKYPSITVEIFNELTPGLKRYNAISKTLTKLPAAKDLALIEKEEQEISFINTKMSAGEYSFMEPTSDPHVFYLEPEPANEYMRERMWKQCTGCGKETIYRKVLITLHGEQESKMCTVCKCLAG